VLSVVVPVFDEQDVLPLLVPRLRPVLDGLGEQYEVLFVDDGSGDATPQLLAELAEAWPEVRVVRLASNAGHQAALTAGLRRADGDIVVTMDADLQDPPELVPEMLRTAREERVDVVYAARPSRSADTWFKRRTAGAYYRLVQRMTGVSLARHAGDFRLITRPVVDALNALPEHHRVYRLLIPLLGFPSAVAEHPRETRAAGRTHYPVRKMVLLASDSLVSFTSAPLRLATLLGLTSAGFSMLLAGWVLLVRVTGNAVPGWTSLALPVLFLGAVQLLCLGILGEYVGRVYDEVKRRPAYRVVGEQPGVCERCGRAQG
jgi:glycosyltransferase involved in cell wall biosynthesis